MKRITLFVAAMLTLGLSSASYAQQSQTQVPVQATTGAPQAFKYQSVVRNANGEVIANQPVSFRISILEGSAEGTTVYEETQAATTNQLGLANLSIGNGNAVTGTFNSINWGTGNYYVKIEFDPKGGDNYTVMGTSQMLSVPYSLYADHAKTADNIPAFPVTASLQGTNLQAPFDSPETGMLVYNTASAGTGVYSVVPGYYYNAGTPTDPKWVLLATTESTENNKKPMSCNTYQYGTCAGQGGSTAANNTGFGENVLNSSGVTGTDNTGNGYLALTATSSGAYNTAVGSQSLGSLTQGSNNTAVGYNSLNSIVSTGQNTAFGSNAMNSSTGSYSTGLGYQTLYNNTGNYNTATGQSALYTNTSGTGNSGFGVNAIYANTTGANNTGSGVNSLRYSTTGSSNASGGYEALFNNTTGSFNTGFGDSSGYTNTTGTNNTFLGYKANVSSATLSNATAIGNGASVGESNTVALGNSSVVGVVSSGAYIFYNPTGYSTTSPTGADIASGYIYTSSLMTTITMPSASSIGSAINGGTVAKGTTIELIVDNHSNTGTTTLSLPGSLNILSSNCPEPTLSQSLAVGPGDVGIFKIVFTSSSFAFVIRLA